MKQTKSSCTCQGFTLTEAAIVLGIVGLILGAIWVAAGAVYENMRIQDTTRQLIQIVSGVRAVYAQAPSIDNGDITTSMAKVGAIPAEMIMGRVDPTWDVDDEWGGALTVTGVSALGRFNVSFGNVPNEACVALMVSTTGAGRDPGLVTIIGGGGTMDITGPATLSQAITTCGAAARVSLFFIFKVRA